MKNTVNQDIDAALAEEAEGQHEDIEAESRNSMRRRFHDEMSSFAHTTVSELGKVPSQKTPVIPGVPSSEVVKAGQETAGRFVQNQLTGGVGGTYARSMEGQSPETDPGIYEQANPVLRKSAGLVQDVWGGLEWAGFGELYGGVDRALKPFTRFLPDMLAGPLRGAVAGGSLTGGTQALTERIHEGEVHGKDIGEATAFGMILGAAAGHFAPEEQQLVQKNLPKLTQSAGGTFQQSIREMQRAASRIGGRDWSNQVAFSKLAKFAQGSGDQAVAAKIRLLNRDEPELFKTPIMQKILKAAGRDDAGADAPAVEPIKPGEVKQAFNYPQQTSEVVTHEGAPPLAGAKRGPLGIPIETEPTTAKERKVGKSGATLAKPVAPTTTEWQEKALKFLGDYDPEGEKPTDSAMRRQIAYLAVSGQLKPEHITVGKIARKVQRVLRMTASELERGGQAGFSDAYDTMGVWDKRARALDAAPELGTKPVDPTSPTELKELRDAMDKGRETETTAAGPAKRSLPAEVQKRRRDGKGRFC